MNEALNQYHRLHHEEGGESKPLSIMRRGETIRRAALGILLTGGAVGGKAASLGHSGSGDRGIWIDRDARVALEHPRTGITQ